MIFIIISIGSSQETTCIGSPFQVTTWKVRGSGKYAQYFSEVEEVALAWQDSKASMAMKTLSGEAEDPCREAMPCARWQSDLICPHVGMEACCAARAGRPGGFHWFFRDLHCQLFHCLLDLPGGQRRQGQRSVLLLLWLKQCGNRMSGELRHGESVCPGPKLATQHCGEKYKQTLSHWLVMGQDPSIVLKEGLSI